MVTVEALKKYVNAVNADTEFLQQCVDGATHRIDQFIGSRSVPDVVRDQAIQEVAANLYQRRVGRRDINNFGDPGVVAPLSRPALDPLTPARPILKPWLGVGIA